jgi:hypothetical protein
MAQSPFPIARIRKLLRRFRSDKVGRAGRSKTLFDVYLAVDWSARRSPAPVKPTANAVWVGERLIDDRGIMTSSEMFFRTRWECSEHLRSRLDDHTRHGRRVFVGFDFAYGYPAGFADACDLKRAAPPWRLVWDELGRRIEDPPTGASNHFQVAGALNDLCKGKALGPFWGCPVGEEIPGLNPKSPPFPYQTGSGINLNRLRETERRLRGVLPTWQLFGAGAVGSQTLLGIPAVARLRNDPELQKISRVWPFETGFGLESASPGTPLVLHAEIWPGVVRHRFDPSLAIKDKAGVRAMVNWLGELDMTNALLPLFGRPVGLSDDRLRNVVEEEGWILGSGLQDGA